MEVLAHVNELTSHVEKLSGRLYIHPFCRSVSPKAGSEVVFVVLYQLLFIVFIMRFHWHSIVFKVISHYLSIVFLALFHWLSIDLLALFHWPLRSYRAEQQGPCGELNSRHEPPSASDPRNNVYVFRSSDSNPRGCEHNGQPNYVVKKISQSPAQIFMEISQSPAQIFT